MAEIASWIATTLAASSTTECAVLVTELHQLNLRWALNALTTNGHMVETTATVMAIEGKKISASSGSVTSEGDLLRLLATAERGLAHIRDDAPDAMPLINGGVDGCFAHPADEVPVASFAPLTQGLSRAFARAREEGHVLFGFAEYHRATTWLGTSAGTRRRHVQPMGRFEFTAKSPDFINSAWVGQETRDFTDVDVDAQYEELLRRLSWGKRRIDLEPGAYETILSPGAVVDLLFPMLEMLSARDAAEGQSPFSAAAGRTRIGERFSALPITIATDPDAEPIQTAPYELAQAAQPGVTSLFDNGAPVGRVEWFHNGVLRELTRTRSEQHAAGIEGPLAYLSDNLIVDGGGTRSIDEMVAATKKGLLVTCFWYIRVVDPQTALLTGLTRDGVYVIEDGTIVGAANNFRWNESPISVLGRVTEVSRAQHCLCREWNDWFTRSVVPAFRVPDFCMSTVSQAV